MDLSLPAICSGDPASVKMRHDVASQRRAPARVELATLAPSTLAAGDTSALTEHGEVPGRANGTGSADLARDGRWAHAQGRGHGPLTVTIGQHRLNRLTVGLTEMSIV